MLERLSERDQTRLVSALETAETLLGGARDPGEPNYVLRPHEPGDIGWIIHRHGVLYAEEYGLDMRFEALVARIAADFIDNFDARRERCWIAERDGEIASSVLLVKDSEEIAKLRLLYVEPKARGLGIGRRLVQECLGFARRTAYRKNHAMDQRRAGLRRSDLRSGGVSLGSRGTASQLWPRYGRTILGIAVNALTRPAPNHKYRRAMRPQGVASAILRKQMS